MKFSTKPASTRRGAWKRTIIIFVVVIALLGGGGFIYARSWYTNNLQPVSTENTAVHVSIPEGSSPEKIAEILHGKGLIRNKKAFNVYVRSRSYAQLLRYGVYELSPSMSAQEIVKILVEGNEASEPITFPPKSQINGIKRIMVNAGFDAAEVDAALEPNQYRGHPALVSLPEGHDLEGYLFSETYHVSASTTAAQLVRIMLDETADKLTPARIQAYASRGLSIHQALTLASIVESEVSNNDPSERPKVAQVFYKRLAEGMKLESNATDGWPEEYDTYNISGLPPGPIGTVGETALEAVANPSKTDYLFFVSGSDCVTRFSRTIAEHEALIAQYGLRQADAEGC